MSAVALVPRRADSGPRDRLWEWCRAHWAEAMPDMPIIEGHDDNEGPFNRSRAMNRARALAPDADVAFILDADVILSNEQIEESITIARDTGGACIAYTDWLGLNQKGTERILTGYVGSWDRFVKDRYKHSVSSAVAVPLALWDRATGFDERFCGWGFEDSAFMDALHTFGGRPTRLAGNVWHLFHHRTEQLHGAVQLTANRELYAGYANARGDRVAMRAVLSEATP